MMTVSDTASLDHTLDKAGPLIEQRIRSLPGYTISRTHIVPDDRAAIQSTIIEWTDPAFAQISLILTTGGTGFGQRDCTPEAVEPLLERRSPGFVHLILSSNPRAVLSRPVAGIRLKTLIITLPGSPKAVSECLDELLNEHDILGHALQLSQGEDSRELHKRADINLDRSTGSSTENKSHITEHSKHSHSHCGHEHTVPRPRTQANQELIPSVARRSRQSAYPIIPLEKAYELIFLNVRPLPEEVRKVDNSLRGHVLAEAVIAEYDMPRLPSSNVDGYAMKASQIPGIYQVLHPSMHSTRDSIPEGSIYRINTGAPLPEGTDAVIMVEDTSLVSSHISSMNDTQENDEKEIETLAKVDIGENVRQAGSDLRAGDKVLDNGHVIGNTGGDIGTLAFIGRKSVKVIRKPIVAVLSTGNELRDINGSDAVENGHYWSGWDANRPTLMAALDALGYTVVDGGIVPDGMDAHEQALQSALQKADIVVTTGGSSMGTTDFLKPVIEQRLHGSIIFGRVMVKPGKPTIFAQIPCKGGFSKPLFGLPGNPASALVTFYLFVLPALRLLGGYPKQRCQLRRIKVQLNDNMRLDPRPEFHRAWVEPNVSMDLIAFSTGGQRSSRAPSLSGANALIALPARLAHGPPEILKGEVAEALLIDYEM